MATRGGIVRIDADGTLFGVRHMRYSMPEALGKTLWSLYHDKYKGDLGAMLTFLIDEHTAGWSNLVGANFELPPNYQADAKNVGPQCYCHGRLSAGAFPVTVKTVFEQGMSWLYAFDEAEKTLWVLFSDLKSKSITNSYKVPLDGDEPDWMSIRCGKKYERCEHLASEHFPELVNTPSGRLRTAVYMNQEPLTVIDVVAVMQEGIRFELTGRTKQGNDVIHAFALTKGSKTEKDITIAHTDVTMPGGFRPSERIAWVFPPTKKDKGLETTVDYYTFVGMHQTKDGKPKKKLVGGLSAGNELLIQVGERRFTAKAE